MKATQTIIQQRVEQVLKIRLCGAEFHNIRDYAAESDPETGRPWQVSDSQLWRYVAKSDELLASSLERNRDKLLNRHLGQRRALFARAMEAGDWRTALAILRDEGELLNLYPPKRTEVSGPDGGPLQTATLEMTESERTDAISALFARVGTRDTGQADSGTADESGPPLGAA